MALDHSDHHYFEALPEDRRKILWNLVNILRTELTLVNPDDTAIEVFSDEDVLNNTKHPKPALAA
jgi:hypothetical protein